MDITAICRAYVDLIVNVTEKELNALGFQVGDDLFLEERELQGLIDKYLCHGKIIPGSPAANTVATTASLGGKTAFIGKVTRDELGKIFIEDFKARGVVFNTAIDKKIGTASTVIFITPDGERTIIYNPRVADNITVADIERNKTVLEQANFLYVGLTRRGQNTKTIISLAKKYAYKSKIVMGLQSYESGCLEEAEYVLKSNIILGNQKEFQNFLIDSGEETLEKLSKSYPDKIFACTLAERGAVIVSNNKITKISAAPIEKIIDTTGAGDAWAGGFLFGLSKGHDLLKAGRLGSECATRILKTSGARLPII